MTRPVPGPLPAFQSPQRRWVAFAGLGLGVALVVWALRSVGAAIGLALLLAYTFGPLVDRAEKRGLERGIAAAAVVCFALAALLVFAVLVVPILQAQIMALSERLPALIALVQERFVPWLERTLGASLPARTDLPVLLERVRELEIARPFTSLLTNVFRSTAGFLLWLLQLTLVPFLAFYALRDAPLLQATLLRLIPDEIEADVIEAARRVNDVVATYVRGQLLVIAILAALFTVGYWLAGVPFAVLIGVSAGLLAVIPIAGAAIALGLALALCLFEYGVDAHLLYAAGTFAVIQAFEGNFLTPRILGDRLGLHPLAVILGLVAMAELFGFLGMVLALPLLASLRVLVWPALIGQTPEIASETPEERVDGSEPGW